MSVKTDDLVEQFRPETVHDAHHDDQRCNAQHDGNQTDPRNEKDKSLPLPGKQVSLRDHPFVTGKNHEAVNRLSWLFQCSTDGAFPRQGWSISRCCGDLTTNRLQHAEGPQVKVEGSAPMACHEVTTPQVKT